MLRKVESVLPELRLLTLTGNPLDNRAHDYFVPQLETRGVDSTLAAATIASSIQPTSVDVEVTPNAAPVITPVAQQPAASAVAFDGITRIEIPASSSLTMTASSTVEVRFMFDTTDRGWTTLLHKSTGDAGSQRGYSLWVNQSDGQLFLSTADASGDQYWYLPAGTVKAGTWYEFASVMDRLTGTVHAYLNGVEILSATIRNAPAVGGGNSLYMGNTTSGGLGFHGVIEDVAVWNVARTLGQVDADFAAGVDNDAAALAGHWQFEEAAGKVAIDSSKNHNNGVIRTFVRLDGVNDYIVSPNLTSFFTTDTVTLELSFNAQGAGVIVNETGQSAIDTGWRDSQIEVLSNGEVRARVWNLPSISLGFVSFNSWHHVALRYDAALGRMDGFLDGVKAGSSNSEISGDVAASTATNQEPRSGGVGYGQHRCHIRRPGPGLVPDYALCRGYLSIRTARFCFRQWHVRRSVPAVVQQQQRARGARR